jgi:hypothetical protein
MCIFIYALNIYLLQGAVRCIKLHKMQYINKVIKSKCPPPPRTGHFVGGRFVGEDVLYPLTFCRRDVLWKDVL